jgi:hypothetical protein
VIRRVATLFALLLLTALAVQPATAGAQETPAAPLEEFVQQVARLWLAGDAGRLVELIPGENRVVLDTGSGIENANGRHATAALRALFAERETTATRVSTVTLAGAQPPRGFGELVWTYRTRGAPVEQTRSIYVAALWEAGGWRISELRILP